MFRKILIANRGEIACRIIATARRMSIATVAVYSEADARARHVELADEAWPIGPAPARRSYLDVETIIGVARHARVEAIHPGYGFLSENASFAEACATAGLTFVGPPAAAIRAMGSKAAAKSLMERAGVPVIRGYHGAAQDHATLAEAATRIGYPVLIKAWAGGGGKGMRIVERPETLAAALEGAKREALSAFGDDHVLVEKYLERPRHIEIQIFADAHGNTVALFERDCSIQRRHQKVVEEAPAPGMDARRRRAMGDAACAAARAVGYVGAGTVEFIVDGGAFYFMEMNTRLQVEHPVTEMITGQDLVEWQFRVAAGERLPLLQDQIGINGHAIEVRVYAEDPSRDFLPSTGTLLHLRQPAAATGLRVDTGVREGDVITPHYDPMIAKMIVHGADRAEAVRRLQAALQEYEVVGVQTNLELLRAIAAHPGFAAAELDTGFIERHADALLPSAGPALTDAAASTLWAAATLAVLGEQRTSETPQLHDPWSPWSVQDAWRLNGIGYQDVRFRSDGEVVVLRAYPQKDGCYRIDLPSGRVRAEARIDGAAMQLRVDGVLRSVTVVRQGDMLVIVLDGRNHNLHHVDPLLPPPIEAAGDERLIAPIPARVTRVLVDAGDIVRKGAPLLVLEAMKMEMTLTAPLDGTIESVRAMVDEMVEEGTELITFARPAS